MRFEHWKVGFGKEKWARTLLNVSHFRNSTASGISAQLKRKTTVPFRFPPGLPDVPGMRIFA